MSCRWKEGDEQEIETCWHFEGPTTCQAPADLSRLHPVPWEEGRRAGPSCSEQDERNTCVTAVGGSPGCVPGPPAGGARALASAKAPRQAFPGLCEEQAAGSCGRGRGSKHEGSRTWSR